MQHGNAITYRQPAHIPNCGGQSFWELPLLGSSSLSRALLPTCLYSGSPWDRVSPLKIQSSHSNSCRTGKVPVFSCSSLAAPAPALLLLPLFAKAAQAKENVKSRQLKSQDLERKPNCGSNLGKNINVFSLSTPRKQKPSGALSIRTVVCRWDLLFSHLCSAGRNITASLLNSSCQLQKRNGVFTRSVINHNQWWDCEMENVLILGKKLLVLLLNKVKITHSQDELTTLNFATSKKLFKWTKLKAWLY